MAGRCVTGGSAARRGVSGGGGQVGAAKARARTPRNPRCGRARARGGGGVCAEWWQPMGSPACWRARGLAHPGSCVPEPFLKNNFYSVASWASLSTRAAYSTFHSRRAFFFDLRASRRETAWRCASSSSSTDGARARATPTCYPTCWKWRMSVMKAFTVVLVRCCVLLLLCSTIDIDWAKQIKNWQIDIYNPHSLVWVAQSRRFIPFIHQKSRHTRHSQDTHDDDY